MKFLNKLYTKGVFSEDSGLNVVATDLGENMISVEIEGDVVNRLPTATGTVGSLSIFLPMSATIQVLKTSPVYENYINRCLDDGYVGGTFTFYDDVNQSFEMEEISLTLKGLPEMGGTQPCVEFVVQGNWRVNRKSIVGL